MCSDPIDGPPLKRIAKCACFQFYPECDYFDVLTHITDRSSPVHVWVYLDKEYFPEGPPPIYKR